MIGQKGPRERRLLKVRAYEELKRMILAQELAPGVFASERELGARLGMSKTPVRAALERLEMEGFVLTSPQQGIVIRVDSVEEIVDMYDIREALESHVVRRVAGNLGDEQIARVEENLAAQRRAAEEGDQIAFTEVDAGFHQLFCAFSRNQEIVRVMAGLRSRLYRVVVEVMRRDPGRALTASEEHRQIFECVRAGDGERAADRVRAHLAYGKRLLLGLE